MGCVKSKRDAVDGGDAATQNSVERGGHKGAGGRGEKAYLVVSSEEGEGGGGAGPGEGAESPPMNPALAEYAQRLSEEIVARAVQQWAELDSRYSDIPYIECDVP